MTNRGSAIADWMCDIAAALARDLTVDGYGFQVQPTLGPIVFVVIKDAAEDTTTARDARNRPANRVVAVSRASA